MTAAETWLALEKSRTAARRSVLWRVLPPLGIAVLAALLVWWSQDPDSTIPFVAGTTAMLALTYAALSGRMARRAFERHHQVHVLPRILEGSGAVLSCSPDTAPSWVALHRAHLFPSAQQARPGPLLYGAVDGVFMEAGAVVLTTERVIRKVRRVQKPVFTGAVYTVDLGPGNAAGDVVVLGRRSSWPKGARKGARWHRLGRQGLPWGTRVYARAGTSPVLDGAVIPFIGDVLRAHPHARLSVQDARHLVVAVPGRADMFRPASMFAPLGRDARAARSLEAMRRVGALARALGAPEASPEMVVSQEAEPLAIVPSPKEAVVRAYDASHPVGVRPVVRKVHDWAQQVPGLAARVRHHPWSLRAGAVGRDMIRSLKGSTAATSASETVLEGWDGVRARLGLETKAPLVPRVRGPEPVVGDRAAGVPLDAGQAPKASDPAAP